MRRITALPVVTAAAFALGIALGVAPGIALGVALGITGARANTLPIPPVPPARPPLADIAPVPDEDAHAPVPPASEAASVDVRFFHPRQHNPSLGFAPGSAYQINEDRKPLQPPGFNISVPLK